MVRWLKPGAWFGLLVLALFILSFTSYLYKQKYYTGGLTHSADVYDVGKKWLRYNRDAVNSLRATTNSARIESPLPESQRIVRVGNTNITLDEFYQWNLLDHPGETNLASQLITQNKNLLGETKRVFLHLFRRLFANYTHAMLLGVESHENKGDSAIGMGEIELLHDLNIKIVFECTTGECTKTVITQAQAIAQHYRTNKLVIFCSGGGNMALWHGPDSVRMEVISMFPNHKIAIFPQSTWYKTEKEIQDARKTYNEHKNLIIFLRDFESYMFAKEHFHSSRTLLSPDIAMYMSPMKRFMPPSYDLIWLRREDQESSQYRLPKFPSNLSYVVSDWMSFKTPKGGNIVENIALRTTVGYTFLLRGRVFITDRLHGHILGVLLGIPHVIIDNKIRKITRYRDTWTKGLDNVLLARDPSDALEKALYLLRMSSK